jgi:hypothetical protein
MSIAQHSHLEVIEREGLSKLVKRSGYAERRRIDDKLHDKTSVRVFTDFAVASKTANR